MDGTRARRTESALPQYELRWHQFSLRTCLIALSLASILIFYPLLTPLVAWLVLFLGPQADRQRNWRPIIWLALALYAPTILCFVISEQSRFEVHIGWDDVASKWLKMAPYLPGILLGSWGASVFGFNFPSAGAHLLMAIASFVVLVLLTLLARLHKIVLYLLVTLALLYSVVLSVLIPAGMRI